MSFATILPLSIVMIAGPQILSSFFFATSREWRRNSLAYVVGAALSISLVVSVVFVLGGTSLGGQSGSNPTFTTVVVLALLAAMVHTYLKRDESEPPKWMGKLAEASPRFSFRLGFLLLGFFPTDLLTSVAVGSYLVANDLPLTDSLGFIGLTLLLLALPGLAVLVLGERAERTLPKIRDWMNDNAWIVNEVVLAFFVLITLT